LLNPSVPRDLETLCLKCLEKDPYQRYPSARELAHELGRFLANEPIHARPLGTAARTARWCRRRPWQAAAMTLLLVVAVGSPLALWRINNARGVAENARRETQKQLYTALLEQARATVRGHELGRRVSALDALRRAAAITNTPELRREAFAALALPDLRFKRELPLAMTTLELDPAFQRVACCRDIGPVEIRSATDGALLATLPASAPRSAYVIKWSPSGRYLAVKRAAPGQNASEWDDSLEVWEVANARRILFVPDGYHVMRFHPALDQLLDVRPNGTLVFWDLERGEQIQQLALTLVTNGFGNDTVVEGMPTALAYSPDGQRFAAVYGSVPDVVPPLTSGVFRVHSTNGGILASATFTNYASDLSWHPSGRWVGITDLTGAVHLMDAQTGEDRILGHHKAQAATTAFSPDGGFLFSGGWDRELICWDLHRMEAAFSLAVGGSYLQFSADGSHCAVITKAGLRFYRFERATACREPAEELRGNIGDAAFSADGGWLAASDDKQLWVWNTGLGGAIARAEEGAGARICFSPRGELLASGEHGCLRWRVAPATHPGEPPQIIELPPLGEDLVSLWPLSNGVVLTSRNGSLVLEEDRSDGDTKWRPTVAGFSGASADETMLAIFKSYGSSLDVYRLPSLEPLAHLNHNSQVNSFAFSPRGDELAVVSSGEARFWSTKTWKPSRQPVICRRLIFCPDSAGCWLTRDFRSGGLYDATGARPLLPLPIGTLPLALSADGRFLAVSVDARRLQVWDLAEVRRQFKDLGVDWERNE
jgi:WD40 repeat protein